MSAMRKSLLAASLAAGSMIASGASAAQFDAGATAYDYAVRGHQVQLVQPPEWPTGINGLPLAIGLTGCDEFRFYADQFGLPDWFDGIAWRESNCRNEDSVKTSCCVGYLQLWVALHMDDHRIGWRYRERCGVTSHHDINSNDPREKQKSVCAAAELYAVMGSSPWKATR